MYVCEHGTCVSMHVCVCVRVFVCVIASVSCLKPPLDCFIQCSLHNFIGYSLFIHFNLIFNRLRKCNSFLIINLKNELLTIFIVAIMEVMMLVIMI